MQKQNGLTVLVTSSEIEAPFRKIFDTIPVLENFSEEILDSVWYDEQYILFSTHTALYGLEFRSGLGDSLVQKIASFGGFLFVNDKRVTVINDEEISVIALE